MPSDEVAELLRDHAVQLPDPEMASPRRVPPPLREWLDGASVVGLGEATHGTRECFEGKARVIQHLVRDAGFRTVAFEADAAATTALDEFVRTGDHGPTVALTELDMWQWRTVAVMDLLTWLREFNAGRPAEDQVRVRGIDPGVPSAPAGPLETYLERVDPEFAGSDAVSTLTDPEVPETHEEPERTLAAITEAVETVAARLHADKAVYVAKSTQAAWADARHFCRVIEQACEWHRVRHEHEGPHPEGMAMRDRFMAENVGWMRMQDAGQGVAVWAHDGHVQRGTFDDGTVWRDATTMGERLDREFGEEYRPLGFDFGRGAFRAVDARSGALETFSVEKPLPGSATEQFALLDTSCFLDFGGIETSWLDTERATRYVGSVYDPSADERVGNGYARTALSASFDGLLFVEASSPTRAVGED